MPWNHIKYTGYFPALCFKEVGDAVTCTYCELFLRYHFFLKFYSKQQSYPKLHTVLGMPSVGGLADFC